jgi:hypothetical protein
MIGHRDSDGRALDPLLHDDVTPTVSDLDKPVCRKDVHTSRPDSTRNLPNRNLQTRHKDLAVEPVLDFRGISRFKEQLDGFYQSASPLFDGGPLTRAVRPRMRCSNLAPAWIAGLEYHASGTGCHSVCE